jgi:hypothetical protein
MFYEDEASFDQGTTTTSHQYTNLMVKETEEERKRIRD